MNIKKTLLLSSVVGVLILGGGNLGLICDTASASEPLFTVYGEVTKEAVPDSAKIYGSIEKISLDGVSPKEDILLTYENLGQVMSRFDIDEGDLCSTYYYEGACNFDGKVILRTSLDFCLSIDGIQALKEIIDEMKGVEFVTIKSITYELNDDAVYQDALSEAKQKAFDKAKRLAGDEELVVSEVEEECYYYNSSYKDFISFEDEDLVRMITVKAKVRVTMTEGNKNVETVIQEEK